MVDAGGRVEARRPSRCVEEAVVATKTWQSADLFCCTVVPILEWCGKVGAIMVGIEEMKAS